MLLPQVHGQIGDPRHHPLDGTLMVIHPPDTFPPTYWPVSESYFKALVHLSPGPNKLRFDFTSPKLSSGSITANHSSWISINYLPLVNNPPLDLVILLGKDSTGTFDAVPERIKREGNGLDVAIRKYRMAAYLWQAFTGLGITLGGVVFDLKKNGRQAVSASGIPSPGR